MNTEGASTQWQPYRRCVWCLAQMTSEDPATARRTGKSAMLCLTCQEGAVVHGVSKTPEERAWQAERTQMGRMRQILTRRGEPPW